MEKTKKGSNSTGKRKELLPILKKDRPLGGLAYFNMWVGIAVIIATFSLGGEGVLTTPLWLLAIACFVGNMFCGFCMTVTGDIGTEHGISFSTHLPVCYGPKGMYFPAILRAVIGTVWYAVQTWFGALAINIIVKTFTGFDNWIVWFIVFDAVQVANVSMGIKAIEKLTNLAAPCILVICLWIFIKTNGIAAVEGISLWNTIVPGGVATTQYTFAAKVFVAVFFMNMTYWSTAAADALSLTRFVKAEPTKSWWKRNKRTMAGHMLAEPLVQTGIVIIGGACMIVLGNWNPIEALQAITTGWALVALLVLVIMAQWSTNATSNLMIPAVIFLDLGKGRYNYVVACIICGVLAPILQPWSILENIGGLLTIMGGAYCGMVGVNFADYYIMRKRRLNVPDLYKKNCGQYYGWKGWNMAGVISLALGFIMANIFGDIAFVMGLVVSAISYYILAKFWWFKKYKYVEIESNYSDDYLATSVGKEWVIEDEEEFAVPEKVAVSKA